MTLSVFSILIPLVPALYFFKKHEKPMRVFAIFICTSACFEVYSLITSKYHINNLNVLHVYTVIEYAFIAYFLCTLSELDKIKRILRVSIYLFSIGALYYSFFIANIFQFNSLTRTIESGLLFSFGLYHSYKLFELEGYGSIIKYPYFWVNSGILLYFGGNITMFSLYSMLAMSSTPQMVNDFWYVHSLLNITANIFYFIAFLWSPRQPK